MVADRKKRQRRRVLAWLLAQIAGAGAGALLAGLGLAPLWLAPAPLLVTLLLADRFMRVPGGVAVIVYHSVSAEQDWLPWSDQIAVTPEAFDRQMRMLRTHGFDVLSNRDFMDRRLSGAALPPRPVVIHLDDGYLDNWVAALPILRRHGLPATIMVSLDFIEPGDSLRPTLDDVDSGRVARQALSWAGYLNRAEIRAIAAGGLVEIAAHGTDHGRVETGPRIVEHLSPANWRRLAWVQWRAMPQDKSGWFRHAAPPVLPYGTPVCENAPALAARAWAVGAPETEEAHRARLSHVLGASRRALADLLGDAPDLFCWPENAVTPLGRELAREAGYRATTGGRGENRPDEDPRVISRVHAGDRALGWRWGWADELRLRAACRAFQGNYYWCFPLFALHGAARLLGPPARILQTTAPLAHALRRRRPA